MENFRFVVMGDSQGLFSEVNEVILRKLMNNIKRLIGQPDFLIFLGDMVYGYDNVEAELEYWKQIVDDYYPINMCYPAIGNHEEDETIFSNAFKHLPNEQLEQYKRTAYYFDQGNARFIFLNSVSINDNYSYVVDSKQRAWLENLLNNNNKTHNFVILHIPPFPVGRHYGESLDIDINERNEFWSIIDKYNVDAVFVGHEHHYCRKVINSEMNSEGYSFKNQRYQITMGSSGAPLSSTLKDATNIVMGPVAVYSYMIVDVKDDIVSFNVCDQDNRLIDSFVYDIKVPITPPPVNVIVPTKGIWKYLDNGSDQGVSWYKPDFDDSAWKEGPAVLGYGHSGLGTKVSYGNDSSNKYITTYFRREFQVENPLAFKSLIIRILRDDGAVIYLNGIEIGRSNLPNGAIDYLTFANVSLDKLDENAYIAARIDSKYLLKGKNVLAVEIHQASSSSSDIFFDFQLIGDENNPPYLNDNYDLVTPNMIYDLLIPSGDYWRYLDNGSDGGTTWYGAEFDDSNWKLGKAQLGYGNRKESTVISFGPNPVKKYITTYFRKSFNIEDVSIYNDLIVKFIRDDGAVVYLNGKEVLRSNMPLTEFNYLSKALTSISGTSEKINQEANIDLSYLKNGENIIAVEIHQASASSSDMSFDLELYAMKKLDIFEEEEDNSPTEEDNDGNTGENNCEENYDFDNDNSDYTNESDDDKYRRKIVAYINYKGYINYRTVCRIVKLTYNEVEKVLKNLIKNNILIEKRTDKCCSYFVLKESEESSPTDNNEEKAKEIIMKYLKDKKYLTYQRAIKITKLTFIKVKEILDSLIQKDLIVCIRIRGIDYFVLKEKYSYYLDKEDEKKLRKYLKQKRSLEEERVKDITKLLPGENKKILKKFIRRNIIVPKKIIKILFVLRNDD